MTKRPRMTLACMILLAGAVGRPEAASLKAAPGRFIVHNVQPGRLYDIHKETGLRLTIFNDDNATRTWLLSTHRPSERGRWERGYAEIPDPRWCWFDHNEVTVPPNSKAYANLHLKVPKEEKYYNQHWVATLSVSGKRGQGGIALAVDIRAQIETKSTTDLKTKPDGLLGLKPSLIQFKDVTPGSECKSRVVLYNNDQTAHDYAIASLFEDREITPKVYLTQSYSAIPDSGWIRRKKKVRIRPGRSAVLQLGVTIPKGAEYFGNQWEDILLIKPDKGLPQFVRVQVQTEGKEDTN